MASISQTCENKKGIISKMWQRCKSINDGKGRKGDSLSTVHQLHALDKKSKSLPLSLPLPRGTMITIEKGSFPIYVGPGKERFMIKTEQVNHPLFKIVLEEAELEYGYAGNNGPLVIPCEVDHFVELLIEMGGCDEGIGTQPRVIILAG